MGYLCSNEIDSAVQELLKHGPVSQKTTPVVFLMAWLRTRCNESRDSVLTPKAFKRNLTENYRKLIEIDGNIIFEPFNENSLTPSRNRYKRSDIKSTIASNVYSTIPENAKYPSSNTLFITPSDRKQLEKLELYSKWNKNLRSYFAEGSFGYFIIFALRDHIFETKSEINVSDIIIAAETDYGTAFDLSEKDFSKNKFDTSGDIVVELKDLPSIKESLVKYEQSYLNGQKQAISDHQSETKGINLLIYGVPGCGKSYYVNERFCMGEYTIERTVFHPDYTNADFVGQILPVIQNGEVRYEFVAGPFTRILKEALNNPKKKCALIVEEINRGNASAIFGPIFNLLDRNEEGNSRYWINEPNIANYVYGEDSSENIIAIPSNLSLIATMNSSDQNVTPLDTAFQRRWTMELIFNIKENCPYSNVKIYGTNVTWGIFVEAVNKKILTSLDGAEDKRLGFFFASRDELSDKNRFSKKVLKYLWDDAFRYDRKTIFNLDLLPENSIEGVLTYVKESEDNFLDILSLNFSDQ